jgi:hypothetical protein
MLLLRKSKDIDWLTIRNMCPCRGTYVPADCCFSKLGKKQPSVLVWYKEHGIIISSHVTCFRHDIAEKLIIWR